jgi:nucleotide-binding universal stress UspA family protein
MYEKIVVPLDGSPLAEVALPYAEEIAGKMSSEIILFSVLPSEEQGDFKRHQTYSTKILDSTRRHVEKYVEKSARKSIKIGTATRIGNPAEGILDYVNKRTSNLFVVMATHGRSGVGRWAVGSVADKVVRATSKQPLMLIRAKGCYPDIRARRILKKALVPLDGSVMSEAVIPSIIEIARRMNIEFTLLQVMPKANHSKADVESYLLNWCHRLGEEGLSAKYEVRTGAPADQIIDLADELAVDVVAMSTHGQSALPLWSLGSVAQKVLLAGNTPLILIKG